MGWDEMGWDRMGRGGWKAEGSDGVERSLEEVRRDGTGRDGMWRSGWKAKERGSAGRKRPRRAGAGFARQGWGGMGRDGMGGRGGGVEWGGVAGRRKGVLAWNARWKRCDGMEREGMGSGGAAAERAFFPTPNAVAQSARTALGRPRSRKPKRAGVLSGAVLPVLPCRPAPPPVGADGRLASRAPAGREPF